MRKEGKGGMKSYSQILLAFEEVLEWGTLLSPRTDGSAVNIDNGGERKID